MTAIPTNALTGGLPTQNQDNPFPGLRSFESDEDYLFFGREAQIDQLLALLRRTRFLAVVGTSGSGKSSLIRSGLVPSLHSGFMTAAGSSWRVAVFRPGEDPIGNLASALADPEVLAPGDEEPGAEAREMNRALMDATLRRGDLGLVECRRRAPIPPEDNLLVIADQFEELFRFKENRCLENAAEASVTFVKLLLEAAAQDAVPVYVVLTMRSEFVGHCTEFVGFAEAINRGQYLIPRLSRQERRQAIVGPVAVGGAEISSRLVTRLLNDVGEDPDQLPILQHALMRTWDHWCRNRTDGEPLDLGNYEAIGTLSEALSQHAEEAFGDLDARQQEIAERMFKALTEQGIEGRGVRSPRRLGELAELTEASQEQLLAVIERFRLPGRSFLMPPRGVELDADSIIDISHESLMRVWQRLRSWVDEEARSAQIYRRLAKAAQRHQNGKGGLWRDPDLQMALNWRRQNRPTELWAEDYDPSFLRAMGFLEASRQERDEQLRQREAQRRRQLKWMRYLALSAGVVALVMALLGLYALERKARAEVHRLEAVEGQRLANSERQKAQEQEQLAETRRQDAEQQKLLAETRRQEAELQKQRADRQRQEAEEQEKLAEQRRQEAEAQERIAEERRQQAEEQERLAEEQRRRAEREEQLARTARAKAEREERRAEARRQQARAKTRAEQSLRWSEDQVDQATRTALGAYRLYRQAQERLDDVEAQQAHHDPSLYSALYQAWTWGARDDAQGGDGEGRIEVSPRHALRTASYHDDAVRALAVRPGGRFLASGDDNGRVRLVELDQPTVELSTEVAVLSSAVRALAWSPDGRDLAGGTYEGLIYLWQVDGSSDVKTGRSGVESVSVCEGRATCHLNALLWVDLRESARLLSASSDGAVRRWQRDSSGQLRQAGDPLLEAGGAPVVALAVAADGRTLAAGLEDGILLWNLGVNRHLEAPQKWGLSGSDKIRSLALRPDGNVLVAGTEGGSLVFWDLADGVDGPGAQKVAHKALVTAVDFAEDEDLLASASLDGSVRLWRLHQGRPSDHEPIDLEDHGDWVWDVVLTADGEQVISGGADRKIRVRPTSALPLFEDLCGGVHGSCSEPLQLDEAP